MRVSRRCKLLLAGASWLATLAGCRMPPQVPAPSPATAPPVSVPLHVGTPYEVVPDASLLVVLVYRGGTLASAGHNHVIASHQLSGTLYLPADRLLGSFELHVPVATLTVDEAPLRAEQSAGEFPPDVSESAREGTRRNMLGPALLDAAHYPQIVLRALRLQPPAAGTASAANAGTVVAQVQSTVRAAERSFAVPVHYTLGSGTLVACGEFALRQSDLGLTPFSAMLGALQVQDEMHVSFRISARAAQVSAGPAPPTALAPDTPCAAPRP